MGEGNEAGAGRIIKNSVDARLGRELFRLGPLAQGISLIAGVILVAALSPVVPWPRLAGWFALLSLSIGYRVWLVHDERRHPGDDAWLEGALRRYRVALAGTGAVWGAAAFLTWPDFPPAYQAIVGMILAGIAAGAVTLLTALRGFYLAFVIPALVPAALLFLTRGTVLEASAGLIILFALASMHRIQRNLHGVLRRNAELGRDLEQAVSDLETVADSVPVGIVYLDRDAVFRYCNRQYAMLLQTPKDRIEGRPMRDVLGETAYQRNEPYVEQALAGEPVRYETVPESPTLMNRAFDIRYVPDFGPDGRPRGVFAVLVDVTDFRLAQRELAKEKELAQTTLDTVSEGVIRAGVDGVVRYLNPAAEDLTGWTDAASTGRSLHEVLPAWDGEGRHAAGQIVRIVGGGGAPYRPADDLWLTRPGGTGAWLGVVAHPLHGQEGDTGQIVIIIQDRTQARRTMDELAYRAAHDPLTGLPNRRDFESRLDRARETARRTGHRFTLLMLDLDGFKQVNDTAGHLVGDRLLVRVANALKRQLRREDVVARIGGDEFAVLLPDAGPEEAERVGEKLMRGVRGLRLDWQGHRFRVGVSIGVALLSGRTRVERVIAAADGACYEAKRAGRGCLRHAATAGGTRH